MEGTEVISNENGESQPIVSSDPEKHCWVCFATEEDDPSCSWVRPCNCRGTSKWVHQICLQRWVDEKQKGNPVSKVACPQCNTTYIIVYPDMGPIVVIFDSVNSIIYNVCPFLAAGFAVGSVYWVAVSYGAVTVMQIMGQREGQEFLETADPLFLLLVLPFIPATLIVSKKFQWEEIVLTYLRRHVNKMPILRHIFPSFAASSDSGSDESYPVPPMTDSVSATHVVCSALVFPTVATIVGNVFFRSVKPHVQRTALGAIAFLICKGAFRLYHKQQMYARKRQRKILDYNVDDMECLSDH